MVFDTSHATVARGAHAGAHNIHGHDPIEVSGFSGGAPGRFEQDRQHPGQQQRDRRGNDTLDLNFNDPYSPYMVSHKSNDPLKMNVSKD